MPKFLVPFFLLGELLPASTILTSTEASILPGTVETITPSPEKRCGAVIVELLGGTKIPRPSDISRGLTCRVAPKEVFHSDSFRVAQIVTSPCCY